MAENLQKSTMRFFSVLLLCILLQENVEARSSNQATNRPEMIALPNGRLSGQAKRFVRGNEPFPFEAEGETDNRNDATPSTRDNDVIWINGGPTKRDETGSPYVQRERRQLSDTTNTIETLVVVDNAAFEKYRTRNNGDVWAAIREVRRYYAGIIRSVNDRFAKLDEEGFSIRVALTRVLTLSGPSRFFTKGMDDDDNDGNIDGYEALSRLDEFSRLAKDIYPHDYLIAMTGYDLRTPDGGDLVGVTFGGGICTPYKQGIAEDDGDELVALTVTHEIAHSVGALHDEQMNACPDTFFTMMPNTGKPTNRSQAGNPFTFSECSKDEIRSFVTGEEAFCLRERNSARHVNLDRETRVPLGQIYNADEQCANTFGNGSVFCRVLYNQPNLTFTDDLCYGMLCFAPGTDFCYFTYPFFGTTCGDGRWCKDGMCVSDPRAPATISPTCPQNDDPEFPCSQDICPIPNLANFTCCATCNPK